MATTTSGFSTTLGSSRAACDPGVTLAGERLLPVVPALQPLLPGQGLRRGTTVAVGRSAALALALVAGASAAGSWVAAVGLPDLGMVAAAETGIVLERLALVPAPATRAWPTVVAALLDAVDVVLVRSPAGLPAGQARRLAARARERGAVLIPLGAWSEPADLRLAVAASAWHGLGQGDGRLQARLVEVVIGGRLVELFCSRAAELGAGRCFLRCPDTARHRRFYQGHGFAQVARLPRYYHGRDFLEYLREPLPQEPREVR